MRYSKDPVTCFLDDSQTNWLVEDILTAKMQMGPPPIGPLPPPIDFPPADAFLSPERVSAGAVSSSAGVDRHLEHGLRLAFPSQGDINSVKQVPIPHDNGASEHFVSIFRKVGWDIMAATGDTDIQELGGQSDSTMRSAQSSTNS